MEVLVYTIESIGEQFGGFTFFETKLFSKSYPIYADNPVDLVSNTLKRMHTYPEWNGKDIQVSKIQYKGKVINSILFDKERVLVDGEYTENIPYVDQYPLRIEVRVK